VILYIVAVIFVDFVKPEPSKLDTTDVSKFFNIAEKIYSTIDRNVSVEIAYIIATPDYDVALKLHIARYSYSIF